MRNPAAPAAPIAASADLDDALQRIEQHLDDLQASLSARDLPGIELHASALQRALSQVAARFSRAARQGHAPLSLRRRLGVTSVAEAMRHLGRRPFRIVPPLERLRRSSWPLLRLGRSRSG